MIIVIDNAFCLSNIKLLAKFFASISASIKAETRFSAQWLADSSENPFLPAFEAKKIATNSRNKCSKEV
jgi:hypothetical protein